MTNKRRRSTLEQVIRKLAEGRKEFAAGKELEAEPLASIHRWWPVEVGRVSARKVS